MSNRFIPHMEILPPAQMRIWPKLAAVHRFGLVLYGGTAIALRLGHRSSVDFDFFTEHLLDKPALNDHFQFIADSTVIQDTANTYTVLVPPMESTSSHVKVSFFGAIRFGRVGMPSWTEDGVMQVASLDDLMATKLKVLLQRVEAKDYIDIAAMVNAGVSLGKGLASAKRMYGSSFQPSESLKAMVYFEGGDLASLSNETKNILIASVSRVRDLPQVDLLSSDLTGLPSV
ncbi:MAG: nucleotidyl transferase AbiEii/AbiGii toxin family protein [Desulfobacterales bacterium]|nr:nucleotidyl transferase AbiEii/AbiGii toxin family protein [Desulfobacterales bacterium]